MKTSFYKKRGLFGIILQDAKYNYTAYSASPVNINYFLAAGRWKGDKVGTLPQFWDSTQKGGNDILWKR
jgi:hypothetical protein